MVPIKTCEWLVERLGGSCYSDGACYSMGKKKAKNGQLKMHRLAGATHNGTIGMIHPEVREAIGRLR